jgi:uncharacterized protein (DUF1697 family)
VSVQIALLRGINLGPTRRVPMAELRALLTDAGYGAVRTHLQSGNVVLESEAAPDALQAQLEEQLAVRFGFQIPVIVRSRGELGEVIARDPFGGRVTDPRRYQVTFLASEGSTELEARLRAVANGGEEVAVIGREIYAWHPDGIARSDLAKLVADRRTGGTARNWNTITALWQLAGG